MSRVDMLDLSREDSMDEDIIEAERLSVIIMVEDIMVDEALLVILMEARGLVFGLGYCSQGQPMSGAHCR